MRFRWWLPSILVAALVAGVPLLTAFGLVGPERAFPMFFAGVAIGALSAVALAGGAAFASAVGRPWRGSAVKATVVPLVLTLAVLLPNLGATRHPIHDVTTDPDDTLQFTPDVAAREQMVMARPAVLALQRESYPDIDALLTETRPPRTFERAAAVARSMDRWQVTAVDGERLRIEATATSAIFRFVDDVVIRVRADGDGSRVDVRSRSRMGRSDLGANADRIRAYLAALRE